MADNPIQRGQRTRAGITAENHKLGSGWHTTGGHYATGQRVEYGNTHSMIVVNGTQEITPGTTRRIPKPDPSQGSRGMAVELTPDQLMQQGRTLAAITALNDQLRQH